MKWIVLYIGTIVAANWALKTFGFVSVLGLSAPAGVFFAGLAFTFRDFTHEALGRRACFAAIAVGAGLSYFIEDAQQIALASGVAFGVSELADLLVYERIRRRSLAWSIAASNTVGAVIDSVLFLWLAFGSLAFIEGQVIFKVAMVLPVLIGMVAWKRSRISVAL